MENRKKSNLIGTMRIYTRKAADAAELFFAFENGFQKIGEKNNYKINFGPKLNLYRGEKESILTAHFSAEEAGSFQLFLERFFSCNMKIISKDWRILFDYADEDCESRMLYHHILGYDHKSGELLDEWKLKEYEYSQADYNMYTLKKYMGYSNEKIAEIFAKDNLEKCLKEAAESYMALENSKATCEEAEEHIFKTFPFFEPASTVEEK